MHKGDPIRDLLSHFAGRLDLERLPPYAPMLNPVESGPSGGVRLKWRTVLERTTGKRLNGTRKALQCDRQESGKGQ